MYTQLQKVDGTPLFFCSHDICMPFYFCNYPPYYSNYGMMLSFMAYTIFKSQYLFHT